MAYVKNPNFVPGQILKSEDLVKMEEAIIKSEQDVDILKNNVVQSDWNETDSQSGSFIKNKPFGSEQKTVSFDGVCEDEDGNLLDDILMVDDGIYVKAAFLGQKLRKENFVNGMITGVMTMNGISESITLPIEKICRTQIELLELMESENMHVVLIDGTAMGAPTGITICVVVGQEVVEASGEEFLPLFGILTEPLMMSAETTIPAGLFLMCMKMNAENYFYVSNLSWTDIVLAPAFENFFSTYENNIKVVEVEGDIISSLDFSLYKPGDIIFAITNLDSMNL